MYNFSMKSEEKGSLIQKYKEYILLFFVIIILFVITRYSLTKREYTVYINDVKQDVKYNIYMRNDEQYMHIEDLLNIFKDNIYYDKISDKIIITTYDNILRLNEDDKNFTTLINDSRYLNLNKIVLNLGYNMYVQNNDIYIVLKPNYINGRVNKNRTEIFDKNSNSVLTFANKKDNIQILVDDNIIYENSKIINVVVTQDNNKFYGYMLKDNVKYEYLKDSVKTKEKQIFVKAEDSIKNTTDMKYVSGVILNMIRLSSVNNISEINVSRENIDNTKIYAGFNISQNASNFDPDIFSNMVNSEENREIIISKTIDFLSKNNLAGVCIDFSNFKTSDRLMFIQFIKELAACMHKSGKKILVNLPSTDYIELAKYIDYAVINAYGEKTISSKISGPISSVNYVENVIKKTLTSAEYKDKIIIEIPMYSVLWTERKGTVINAEIYSMPLQKEYISKNNLKVIKDNSSNQSYINYTKGITTFKMWLEDEDSVEAKVNLVNDYELAGISLYKSGMEHEKIYENIVKIFIRGGLK